MNVFMNVSTYQRDLIAQNSRLLCALIWFANVLNGRKNGVILPAPTPRGGAVKSKAVSIENQQKESPRSITSGLLAHGEQNHD